MVGAAIGMNAAFLNIITEWLSDVKLGHCKTAFYLNENFCCWGEDNGMMFKKQISRYTNGVRVRRLGPVELFWTL